MELQHFNHSTDSEANGTMVGGLVVCGDAEGWGYGVYEGREGTRIGGSGQGSGVGGGGGKGCGIGEGNGKERGEDMGEWERGSGVVRERGRKRGRKSREWMERDRVRGGEIREKAGV
jgi:hypothetical protein